MTIAMANTRLFPNVTVGGTTLKLTSANAIQSEKQSSIGSCSWNTALGTARNECL